MLTPFHRKISIALITECIFVVVFVTYMYMFPPGNFHNLFLNRLHLLLVMFTRCQALGEWQPSHSTILLLHPFQERRPGGSWFLLSKSHFQPIRASINMQYGLCQNA